MTHRKLILQMLAVLDRTGTNYGPKQWEAENEAITAAKEYLVQPEQLEPSKAQQDYTRAVIAERDQLRKELAELRLQVISDIGQEIETEPKAEPVQEPMWTPTSEQMPPHGKMVLAYYKNSLGNGRRIRAKWVSAKTEESGVDSDIGEYDEATDTYYDPEGWYECIDNWCEYTAVMVCDAEITHWMPLPSEPGVNAEPQDGLRKAAQMALDTLLIFQEKIEGEWGHWRTNAQIEADGDTDPAITALRKELGHV